VTRSSCRGCASVRRRARCKHAVLRRCMRGLLGVHGGANGDEWRASGSSARACGGAIRRPLLRHCRVVLGELVVPLCPLARRSPALIGVRPSRGCGILRVPAAVRDKQGTRCS
jgi:hypothetical protein